MKRNVIVIDENSCENPEHGDKTASALPSTYLSSSGSQFVKIESGSFMMGDTLSPKEVDKTWPGGSIEEYKEAYPRHKVTISKPFYMGIHEVTVGDFRAFIKATDYKTTAEEKGTSWIYDKNGDWSEVEGLSWQNAGIEQTDRHPVVHVSWYDVQAYIAWLNKKHLPNESWLKGYHYSLPSEAQWEYACRAGTTTTFFWGEEAKAGKGYLNGTGRDGSYNERYWDYSFPFKTGYKATAPVGSFKPNNWGLHDMLGNVWEWCSDWYGAYESGDVIDPVGADIGTCRVNRGGSWACNASTCRSAFRDDCEPVNRDCLFGFRLCLVLSSGQ